VVNEIVGCGGGVFLHKPVENGPKFSTPVDDTPTISWVLALSATGYIVVEPATSGKSTKRIVRAFSKDFGVPLGKWRLDGPSTYTPQTL
jgi:hypothetical protein